MKKVIIILVPFIMVSLLAGTLGAYTYYKKLPAYSMKIIRTSIPNHDWETFSTYVDVDAIVEAAAGELLDEKMAKMEKDTGAYSMNQLSDAYENQVKPEFIKTVRKAFEDYLSYGKLKLPDGKELSDTERMLKRGQINSMQIASITKPSVTEGGGTVGIEFINSELKTSFELKAKIVQQEDGMWKITEVTGWDQYEKAVNRAYKAKLDSLNGPIQRKMQDIVNIKSISGEISPRDEYGFSETLRMNVKVDIKSDQPLYSIKGRINIDVAGGEDTYAPFEIDMNYKPTGAQTIVVDKVLNPFVRSDVKIMRNGLRKSDFHGEITGITYRDGTKLETLTELPN